MEIPLPILGSYFQVIVNEFVIAVNFPVQIMNSDPSRWAFMITQQNNQPTQIGIQGDPTAQALAILGAPGDRFERVFRDFGGLLQGPWFAGTNLGPTDIVVTEILYRPPQQVVSQEL